jgi:EAL domain-containing protein (putative c-di-GMP-specific phosphodiesterase class I)
MPSQPIQLGVHIAFDDFGTGYASLTYLKKFPLDRLKIDRSFVSDLRAGSDDAAIVGCTTNLGKLLGVSVIAEGIEDPATAELLRTIGCQEGRATISARQCRRRNSSSYSSRMAARNPSDRPSRSRRRQLPSRDVPPPLTAR